MTQLYFLLLEKNKTGRAVDVDWGSSVEGLANESSFLCSALGFFAPVVENCVKTLIQSYCS